MAFLKAGVTKVGLYKIKVQGKNEYEQINVWICKSKKTEQSLHIWDRGWGHISPNYWRKSLAFFIALQHQEMSPKLLEKSIPVLVEYSVRKNPQPFQFGFQYLAIVAREHICCFVTAW